MKPYITLLVLLIFIIVLLLIRRHFSTAARLGVEANIGKNYCQKYILTKNEYSFYLQLTKLAAEQDWIICPKVDLKEIFYVTNKAHYMKYFRTIAQKNVDFLICDRALRPIYAIELNDSSHERLDRQRNDFIKQSIFDNSTIPLVSIKAQQRYTVNYIRQHFDK